MSGQESATEYLDYYLDQQAEPDSAVLLEGPWGSGKSYFIANYFKERLAKARKADALAVDPLIHVTLFGVKDLAEITTQMFEKAHPILGGKAAKVVNTVLSRAVGALGVTADAKENATLLQDLTLKLDGRVLVFDDLERSHLPLVEVMGYINRYVEHNKLRVIVVASEADIASHERQDYSRRKEKLVGKTIRVGSDPQNVLDNLLQNLDCKEVVTAVQTARDDLLLTFKASKKQNFRSLRSILFDFERLVTATDPRLRSNPQALRALLLYMVAVGMEFRSGTLDDGSLRSLRTDIRSVGRRQDDPDEVNGQNIGQRYELVAWNDPIIPPAHLADLFSSGAVDVPAVNAFLSEHPAVVGHRVAPPWRRLWSWYELTATDYKTARDELVRQLSGREVVHPGQILHAAGTIIRLRGYDDDLLNGVPTEDYFQKYLDDVVAEGKLTPAHELFGMMAGSYGSLVYNEVENPEFLPIHALVEKASQKALDRKMALEAGELLSSLRTSTDHSSKLIETGLDKKNYGGVAVLHHLGVDTFADLLIDDGSPNDKLFASLHERYRGGYDDELAPEFPWLARLRTELERRAAAALPPHKALCEMRIEYWFQEVAGKIAAFNKSRQQTKPSLATSRKPAAHKRARKDAK
ncbi:MULTISPECIES: P-loop NTPase fold protein [unclassified Ensifer]|uniref:P-loop NTPase fold protein n=1 Tax=unclassified Ensifer TaxID=2633371 RepID=UPI000760DA77|nr:MULTISPECIES: P-loop NTPase fold protein [unclassified Ensifer]